MERTISNTEHVFSHLGAAPYKFVGHEEFVERRVMVDVGVEQIIPRGTSCDHCSTYIVDAFWLLSSDGKRFKVGCDCIAKASMTNTHKEAKRILGRVRRDRTRQNKARARRLAAFAQMRVALAENENLNSALKADHCISHDLRSKLIRFGSLSEKQIALAFKLAGQVAEQNARQADEEARKIAAPEGKLTVDAVILSTRYQDNPYAYGTSVFKMLVMVDTEDGVWKAWGTCPTSLEELSEELKGMKIQLTATFERSAKDESFAFFKRPKVVRS